MDVDFVSWSKNVPFIETQSRQLSLVFLRMVTVIIICESGMVYAEFVS